MHLTLPLHSHAPHPPYSFPSHTHTKSTAAITAVVANDNTDAPLLASKSDSDLLVLKIQLDDAPAVVAYNELDSGLQVCKMYMYITVLVYLPPVRLIR